MGQGIFSQLNEQQALAVRTVQGPVMAVAGAGSGKTRVLTNRIAYLIDEVGIPANHILAITFTNRAAEEMRGRVYRMTDLPLNGIWLSTFHAMGAKILRYDIGRLGYGDNFQIIDDDDSLIIIKNVMKQLGYDVKRYSPKAIAGMIEEAKADPDTIALANPLYRKVAGEIFEAYQKFLKDNDLVDFQDLLVLPLELFRHHPDVLKKYQDWFSYILVDEFQDTNDLQYEIVWRLAKDHRNLFIVGDEDQSIYAFRGANIGNIRKFMRDFPEHQKIVLNQNYRSVTTILDAANAVIRNNRNRIPKDLFSTLGQGERVLHFKAETDEEEAYWIYNRIRALVKAGAAEYRDCAILYRNNAMSRRFEDVMLKYNVPHKVIGNLSFYKRKEIKDVVAYLHLIVNRGDDYAFSRIYNEPRRGIGETTFEKMKEYAAAHDLKLMDLIDPDLHDIVGRAAAEKLLQFRSMIDAIRADLENRNLLETYDAILEQSGYNAMLAREALTAEQMIEAERRRENLAEFKTILLEKLKEMGIASNMEKLVQILTELALRAEAEDEMQTDNYVSLMTMHSAKGLEFKIVFITCFEQSLFPSSQSLFERADVEEERRLFYVALTRAKERVFITNAQQRLMYGHYQNNPDSEFLGEIDEPLIEHQGLARPRNRTEFGLPKPEPKTTVPAPAPSYVPSGIRLAIGDKVRHAVFGEGIVVMIDADKATIAFKSPVGIKILMKDHPSIQKA